MQGFFGKPVDNLHAEPLIARWIRHHVPNWKDAVVVSKNPGGTKRVTSLADALKLNFGIVTTDKRRSGQHVGKSMMFNGLDGRYDRADEVLAPDDGHLEEDTKTEIGHEPEPQPKTNGVQKIPRKHSIALGSSPLTNSTNADEASIPALSDLRRTQTAPVESPRSSIEIDYTDERARDVITGRLIRGHIVDDDHPSPSISAMSSSFHLPGQSQIDDPSPDPMAASHASSFFLRQETDDHALGGFTDGVAESDDEEPGPQIAEPEQTVTLVGNVKGRPVLIVDDMIDKCGSWIAAAETVVLRGGASKVYCIATHGLFGDDSLEQLEQCEYIDYVCTASTSVKTC
jgi:ribose-phosphate pyrophosphokinase